jgi:peptidoglycan/LPS O-acetylase OafA/YrhL
MIIVTSILLAHNYRSGYMQLFLDQVKYAFFYVYNFFNASASWEESRFIGHFWSLSVEEQFYIFWPMVILLTPGKHLKRLFFIFMAMGPLSRFALAMLFNRHVFDFLLPQTPIGLYVLPFSHLDAFALGAYITRFEIPRPKQQLLALSILIPVIGFVSQYLITGEIVTKPFLEITALGFGFPLMNGLKHVWGYALLNYFFAILIYCVVREKLFVKTLEYPFFRYLGKISYGMYVYHYAIIWFVMRSRDIWNISIAGLAPWVVENINKAIVALISFTLTLLIASASYYWMEKPLLDLKDRLFSLKPS